MDKRRPQTKVKVIVRLRPKLSQAEKSIVNVVGNKIQILNHRNIEENLQYEFHTVLDERSTQADVFSASVLPMLNHVLHGQNVSVFAYGPTGAGKTHTMLGETTDPGLIPRVIQALFKEMGKEVDTLAETVSYTVSFSFMEIYNEKVHDLLDPTKQDLPIREDAGHKIFVTGLTEKKIDGIETFKKHFEPAASNRTVGATKLNKHSSRSHTILMLKVLRKESSGKLLQGKLYLIDLAGSEDNRRTGNQGIRLKESGAINRSLFVLGEVVDAINNNLPRVPYRNSKLTRLLQDSIGGSCHSVMITNIAPEERFYYDTYCTLNFATKSKKIVNTVTVDIVDSSSSEKPVAAVKPIKRQVDRPSMPASSSSERQSLASLEPLPSPIVRQQKAFESAIEKKIKVMENMIEEWHRLQSKDIVTQPEVTVKASPHRRKSRRLSKLKEDSPDVIEPTPKREGRLKDATNLLKRRHFGPQTEGCKKRKVMSSVVEDTTSCRPLFPAQDTTKRDSSEDFESPITKKIRSKPKEFSNAGQEKRNAEFLAILNSGNMKELRQLQTVGPKKAKMIFEWREMHGSFSTVTDLLEMPGFNQRSLDTLLERNLLTDSS